ncbi:MAG TPA: phenylalanine--tRNA ligase subunit beta [Candidatus Nanoarchaeia archaeon]|nr:phenylalanine--tRNA ligase subunit beta [Candidatus Nanoarchaeia archaeon]
MATIRIPKSELKKHIKLDESIIEKINLFGTPVESVTEEEIELEIMPNRPDLLSVEGFARAFKAFMNKETGLKKYRIHSPEKNFKVKISPSVNEIRPYTACAIVKKLNLDGKKIRTLIDLQEKLHATIGRNRRKAAIGIYPLEKITLPITYEARKPADIKFIPLESEKEMNGMQILQQHPAGKEYAKLLENYSTFPVFIDSKEKILSMPPIINSNETGKITEQTKEVFIECSGSNLEILKKILNIVVTTMADMGGEIYSMDLDYGKNKIITPDLKPEKVSLSLENANKLLGLELKEKDLEKLLPRMGYEYSKGRVYVPAWRTDILHEVDIIEDIAIAYGYDNLIPEIPKVATIGEESNESKIKSKISDILVGLGLLETSSYHLIKADEAEKAKLDEKDKIELENSKTEYKLLRPNLLIPILRILAENKDNEYPQKIFEIGTVFKKDASSSSETGIKESEHLIVAASPSNFTEIRQILDYLGRMLDIKLELIEAKQEQLIEGRTGSIGVNNKRIGYIGEIHPETLQTWNIKMPISVLEISLDEIFKRL